MLLIADTDLSRRAMLNFLRMRGVQLHASEDLQLIGRIEDKRLIAVVGFNGFCGGLCQMHMAGDGNWITREYLRVAFGYPFTQLKLAAVMGVVGADNERALKLDQHLGFREVHRVKDGWGNGIDLVLLEMKREDCKYIGKDHELARAA